MSKTKQVIVMRRDLGMRKGKIAAQAAHAAMAFLTHQLRHQNIHGQHSVALKDVEIEWMQSSFTKICVKINGLEELLEIRDNAQVAGLTVHLITDSGKTEFGGVPTPTCLAIGPNYSDKINEVTGHLELY